MLYYWRYRARGWICAKALFAPTVRDANRPSGLKNSRRRLFGNQIMSMMLFRPAPPSSLQVSSKEKLLLVRHLYVCLYASPRKMRTLRMSDVYGYDDRLCTSGRNGCDWLVGILE